MGSPNYKARMRAKHRKMAPIVEKARIAAGAVESPSKDLLDNPKKVAASKRMTDFVHEEMKRTARSNTAIAYDGKQGEFKEFCRAVYPLEEFSTLITHEKVYQFFFYTSFREQKKRGGKHSGANTSRFKHEEYKELMNFFDTAPEEGNATLTAEGETGRLQRGQTVLIPAVVAGVEFEGADCSILAVYVP